MLPSLQDRIKAVQHSTGKTIDQMAAEINIHKATIYKWSAGLIPAAVRTYLKFVAYLEKFDKEHHSGYQSTAEPPREDFASLLQVHFDAIMAVDIESMAPTIKHGDRLLLHELKENKRLVIWGTYYLIKDLNGDYTVRKVFPGTNPEGILLVSDHLDQNRYPPFTRLWDQIDKIYEVKAVVSRL